MATFWLVLYLSVFASTGSLISTDVIVREHVSGNKCETERIAHLQLADLARANAQNVNPGNRVLVAAACVPIPSG